MSTEDRTMRDETGKVISDLQASLIGALAEVERLRAERIPASAKAIEAACNSRDCAVEALSELHDALLGDDVEVDTGPDDSSDLWCEPWGRQLVGAVEGLRAEIERLRQAEPLRPSQCRDPELLGGVTPEAVVRWLTAHGWEEDTLSLAQRFHHLTAKGPEGYRAEARPWSWRPQMRGFHLAACELLDTTATADDLWPHEILAELLALSAAIKEG